MFTLIQAAIAYIIGILCYAHHIPYITTCTVLCALALYGIYTKKTIAILLVTLCFTCGVTRYAYYDKSYTTHYNQITEGAYQIVGSIKRIEKRETGKWKTIIILQTKTLKAKDTKKQNQAKAFLLKIFTKHKLDLAPDDIILCKNIHLHEQTKKSLKKYSYQNNIAQTAFLSKNKPSLIKRPKISFKRFLYNLRLNIYKPLEKKLSKKTHSLFSLLFLGKRTPSTTEQTIRTDFNLWGISHYLARSGLHITLFLFIFIFLLQFLPLPFFYKQIALLFFLSIYTLLSYNSTASLRACFMAFCYTLSLLSNSYIHPKDIAVGALFLNILFNPTSIFALDLQLTYSLTMLLCWATPDKHKRQTIAAKRQQRVR